MLTRRDMIMLGAAVPGGALTGRARAAAPATRTLRMGYLLPTQSQLGAGTTAMAEEVARRTEGRIRIEQFPESVLGGEVEMLRGVQLGTIDLAFITGAPLPNVLPDVGLLNIPFLFDSAAHAHAVLDGPVGASYLRQLSEKDLVALAWGENGMRHITNSRRPIATPEDLRGLKIRLPQSPVMLLGFRALQAEASPLPFPQLYSALEARLFDGQENPIATIRSARFAQVQRFLTMSGHVYDPAVVVMSPDAYEDLSEEDRAIFRAAALTGASASRRFAADAEANGVAELKQAGMQVIEGIDRPRFVAAMAAANPEFDRLFGHEAIERVRRMA